VSRVPDRHRPRPWRAEDGNAALELVILAPVVLFLIGLVIAYGRTSVAQGAVDAAARDAARQASIATSPAAAQQAATSSARAALLSDGLQCQPTVRLGNLGQAFGTPLGRPAQVSATVSCTVSLANLLVPGIPGSRRLHASFTSPLDPYRSRSLGRAATVRRAATTASRPAPSQPTPVPSRPVPSRAVPSRAVLVRAVPSRPALARPALVRPALSQPRHSGAGTLGSQVRRRRQVPL